jgi:hypothetical protein
MAAARLACATLAQATEYSASVTIRLPAEVRALVRSRNTPIVLLALVALLIAQAGAGLHALKHLGMDGDATKSPAQHAVLCLECASFAPLAAAHGGAATAFAVAAMVGDTLVVLIDDAPSDRHQHLPFRSRAPPR